MAELLIGNVKGPKGDTGQTGAAATIAVGTTTTLAPGSAATVENVGTSSAAVFNFGIPKGDAGTGSDEAERLIASVETSPAEAAHTAGSELIYDDTLYVVIADIAIGDDLEIGTNITSADSVTDQIVTLKGVKQPKQLGTEIPFGSTTAETVEEALGLLKDYADDLDSSVDTLNSSLADDEDQIDAIVNLYGAKQLIKYPYYDGNSKTQNTVTFTVNDDLSVSLSGTSSGYAAFNFCTRTGNPQNLPTGRYAISGGYSDKIVVSVGKTGGGGWQLLGSSKGVNDVVVFDVDESDNLGICIEVTEAGVATDGITIKQLLTDARIKDKTYVPYAPANRDCVSYAVNTKLGAHNLYDNKATTQTLNGVTFTVNSNKTVNINTVSGGASTNTYLDMGGMLFKAGMYRISGIKESQNVYNIVIRTSDSGSSYTYYGNQSGNDVILSLASDKYIKLEIIVYAGTQVTNKVVYPQITTIEDTDPNFAPFTMTNRELTEVIGNVKEIRAGRFSYTNGASIAGTVTFDKPFTKGTTTVVIITGESGNTQYITLFTVHGASASGFSYIGKNVTGDTTSTERYAQYIAVRF